MSDALLERIAKAAEGLLAHLKGGGGAVAPKPGAAGAATPPKPAATGPKPGAAGAATPPKPAANKTNKGAAAPPPAAAKAANGKYNSDQVRDIIRKVATNANLGKQSAVDILDQDGNGAPNVMTLKPEFYDAVYEACQVALQGEGGAEASADEYDPTA